MDSLRSGELLRSYFRVRIDLRAAFGSIVRTLSSLKSGRIGTWKYERTRQNFGPNFIERFIANFTKKHFILKKKIYIKFTINRRHIDRFVFGALYCTALYFSPLHANCRKVVAVNLEAHITREVTYPS